MVLAGNGRPIGGRDDYATLLAQLAPGDRVTFEIGGGGASRTVTMRAAQPPADLGEEVLLRFVGVKLSGRAGKVVVSRVVAGSRADEAGLAGGDVVLQVNGERVDSIVEIDSIVAREHTRSSLLLVIQRGRVRLPTAVSDVVQRLARLYSAT